MPIPPQYSAEEKTELVTLCIGNSLRVACRIFGERHPEKRPSLNFAGTLIKRLKEMGSIVGQRPRKNGEQKLHIDTRDASNSWPRCVNPLCKCTVAHTIASNNKTTEICIIGEQATGDHGMSTQPAARSEAAATAHCGTHQHALTLSIGIGMYSDFWDTRSRS